MKTNEATIFVFIASIIIGLLISMNMSFGDKSNFLDVKQYEEAYNERNKLYSELNNLKEQYYNSYSKLKKYEHGDEKNYEVLNEIQNEVEYNNLILGKVDIEGQGIKITLNDGTNNFDEYPSSGQLVHDVDIVQVINDLKNAGAEAISVNDQRVIYNTYGLCAGSNIDLNGIKIIAPFCIQAIGNKDVLYNYFKLERNHIKSLKLRELSVDIIQMDNIKISAYTGKIDYKYMRFIDKKN